MRILLVSEYFPPLIKGGGEINLALLAKALTAAPEKNEVSILTSKHPKLKTYEQKDNYNICRRLKTGNNPAKIRDNFKRSLIFPKSIEKEVRRLQAKNHFDLIHFFGTSVIAASKLKKLKVPLIATIESYPALCPKGDRICRRKKGGVKISLADHRSIDRWSSHFAHHQPNFEHARIPPNEKRGLPVNHHSREWWNSLRFKLTECKSASCSFAKFAFCQNKSAEIGKMKNKFYLRWNLFLQLYIYIYYQKLNRSLKYCSLLAISNYIQELLLQQGLQSTVIPNALDLSQFKFSAGSEKTFMVLYLGSLTKFKGPQILLKAIKGLDVRCELYGEGNLKTYLKQFINKYNLNASVYDAVPYEKIPEIYQKTDLVIFPSLWPEPFGRIAIEGLAAGKPVLGSKIGGISETLPEKQLFPPGDWRELRRKIKTIIENKTKLNKWREEGWKRVQQYDEKIIVNKLISFYKKQIPP